MSSSIKTVLAGIVIFLLMQLYQPARNVDYGPVTPIHLSKTFSVPEKCRLLKLVLIVIVIAPTIPWYSYVQPVRMFLDSHINEEELEF
jgi:hypothetical protein